MRFEMFLRCFRDVFVMFLPRDAMQDAYNAPSPDDVIWENVTVPATLVRI